MNVVEGGGAQLDGEADVDYFISFAKSYYSNSTREEANSGDGGEESRTGGSFCNDTAAVSESISSCASPGPTDEIEGERIVEGNGCHALQQYIASML